MDKQEEMRESPRGRSMLKLYTACPRKWAFKYLKGFLPDENKNNLLIGSAEHELQKIFYTTGMGNIRAKDFLYDTLELEENAEKAYEMWKVWYEEIGQFEKERVIPLFVEHEEEVTLPNGYKMTVRYDRVLLDKQYKTIFINDTKTTGWSLEKTIENYFYSDQPKLYTIAFLQNHPELAKQFTGWRTDAIYARKLKKGWSTSARRSDIVTFTEQELNDTLLSYAGITDDIKFKIESVLEHNEPMAVNFPANSDNCLAYGSVCPYKAICHEIDDIKEPPANMTIDSWLTEKTVINSFLKD